MKAIHRIMLVQPNFSWLGKRTWKLLPYGLGLLNASLKKAGYESWIFDPNFDELSEQAVRDEIRRTKPDAIGITSFSTEYLREGRLMSRICREERPDATVILGGIIPTVLPEKALEDPNADYCVMGEGEVRLPALLNALNTGTPDAVTLDGVAKRNGRFTPAPVFLQDLNSLGLPDYGGLDPLKYMNHVHKYAHTILPRQFPYATTITSRGCPYKCIFCGGRTVSGHKVRMRSAENVLREIDELKQKYGIKEIIFLDDHFLHDRKRAVDIMKGLMDRHPDMTWKCVNLTAWLLDLELLELMRRSGCYQITLSPESGNQKVLRTLIKKPGDLRKIADICKLAKKAGLEIATNFVFGLPGETWDQIRDTFRYAERLDVDLVNFHIATPLPGTELMDLAVQGKHINQAAHDEEYGYTRGVIETTQFTPVELQILRSFEWDRINFAEPIRKSVIAQMEGISMGELEEWRIRTRRGLGLTIGWKE